MMAGLQGLVPGLPSAAVALIVERAEGVPLPEDFAENRLAFMDTLPAAMTSSMHQDLDRGSRLEVAWLAGDVVLLLGEPRDEIAGSEWAHVVHGHLGGDMVWLGPDG